MGACGHPGVADRSQRASALLARVAAVETIARSHFGRAEELDRAILATAFRGELVPQDPNDEPAEQMLARLAASTETSPAKGKRGRPRRKDA